MNNYDEELGWICYMILFFYLFLLSMVILNLI